MIQIAGAYSSIMSFLSGIWLQLSEKELESQAFYGMVVAFLVILLYNFSKIIVYAYKTIYRIRSSKSAAEFVDKDMLLSGMFLVAHEEASLQTRISNNKGIEKYIKERDEVAGSLGRLVAESARIKLPHPMGMANKDHAIVFALKHTAGGGRKEGSCQDYWNFIELRSYVEAMYDLKRKPTFSEADFEDSLFFLVFEGDYKTGAEHTLAERSGNILLRFCFPERWRRKLSGTTNMYELTKGCCGLYITYTARKVSYWAWAHGSKWMTKLSSANEKPTYLGGKRLLEDRVVSLCVRNRESDGSSTRIDEEELEKLVEVEKVIEKIFEAVKEKREKKYDGVGHNFLQEASMSLLSVRDFLRMNWKEPRLEPNKCEGEPDGRRSSLS